MRLAKRVCFGRSKAEIMSNWNHGVSSVKQWKLALVAAASVSLTGCFESEYEFEGKYFPAEGEECTTPSNPRDQD